MRLSASAAAIFNLCVILCRVSPGPLVLTHQLQPPPPPPNALLSLLTRVLKSGASLKKPQKLLLKPVRVVFGCFGHIKISMITFHEIFSLCPLVVNEQITFKSKEIASKLPKGLTLLMNPMISICKIGIKD